MLEQYFFEEFVTGSKWVNSTLNYIKTTAIWSLFGYIIGLGDRHSDNILL